MRLLLALALLAPGAAALDALPDAARLGATEAVVVVRAHRVVHVAADAPLQAAVGDAPPAPVPAALPVPPDAAWHGLPGAVELRLWRPDPARAVRVELDDGETGVVVEWPARRDAPGPGAAAAVLVVAIVPLARRAAEHHVLAG